MRTYHCCEAVNDPDIGLAELPALAAHMQNRLDTLNDFYAARSLRGPVAKVTFKRHPKPVDENEEPQQVQPKKQKVESEPAAEMNPNQDMMNVLKQMQEQMQQQQQQQQHQAQQQAARFESLLLQKPVNVAQPSSVSPEKQSKVPYGAALNKVRLVHRESIKIYLLSLGGCTKEKPPPTAAGKRVFKELCQHRTAGSLPAGSEWFSEDVTFFTDENEKPFTDFIRKYWTSTPASGGSGAV